MAMNGIVSASAVSSSATNSPHQPANLEAFHEATLAITSATSLQAALQAAVQSAVNLAGAVSGTISVSRAASSVFAPAQGMEWATPQPAVGRGATVRPPLGMPADGRISDGRLPDGRIPDGRGLDGYASSSDGHRAVAGAELPTSSSLRGTSTLAGSNAPRELTLPLLWHGRTLGALQLRAGARGFAPDCERVLRLICEQAAHAAEGARRFDQLQHAKREWELIFDGMVDGVCICRGDGAILRANRSFADLLGMRLIEILGRKREDLHARLPDYAEIRPWTLDETASPELDLRVTEFRYGMPERTCSETSFLLLSEDAPGESVARRVCIVRDVTEPRRLQEQLLQNEKLAALGELVSGVAHELNNPLTTVVGYGQLLESDLDLPPRARRQVGMIHNEAQRASHIVQNLLAFARRSLPQKSLVSINDVLGSLVRMRAYQLSGDNVRVTTRFAAQLPPLWADPMQLQQVFLNILNNAAHAVKSRFPEGGGEVRISTCAIPDGVAPEYATGMRIAFADNGIGMTPEHLRRVFDPFFTTKGVGQGTGLGMSISLGIVSNHGGRIWAESRPDQGTTFWIELPAAQENPNEDESPLTVSLSKTGMNPINGDFSGPPTPSTGAEQNHILVVDDEEPVVTLITEILALDGHRVTPAFNGAEALALLEIEEFDLIVSDVRMPAVGGPTFFEILQTTRPDLLPRVIFVTGDTVSRSTQDFLGRAKRPVLAKPFDPERLRALVNDTLRQPRQAR